MDCLPCFKKAGGIGKPADLAKHFRTPRTFLRGIRKACFDYYYAAQRSLSRNSPNSSIQSRLAQSGSSRSIPGMILALGVALELRRVEVNLAQSSLDVSFCFIVKMRRGGMAALAPGGHGPGSHFVTKFDDRHEAVATVPVPLLRSGIRLRFKRGQRTPQRRRKSNRNARGGIAEGLNDVPREALKAVDLAPGYLPGAEVCGKF